MIPLDNAATVFMTGFFAAMMSICPIMMLALLGFPSVKRGGVVDKNARNVHNRA